MEAGWISTIFTAASKTTGAVSKTTEVVSGFNDWLSFYQWFRPEKNLDNVQLHEELWKLQTTMPVMQEMIDKAEWSSHKENVANLLKELKVVFYDSENILGELNYYKLKSTTEKGGLLSDFTKKAIFCSFDEVKTLQQKAEHLMSQMNSMVLHDGCRHFIKSFRPETSSFPNESKVFGRQKEIKELIQLLGVPLSIHKRKRAETVAAVLNHQETLIHGAGTEGVHVLAITGIGGVGKTTLAQQICQNQLVKSHFNQELWICVSDDFDVTRLTKELLLSTGEKTLSDSLNSLQTVLANVVKSKRFLLVLDDIWDDVLTENGQEWEKFCAPLTNGLPGSMIIVTTRSSKVAEKVATIDPFPLQGLKDDVFWDFFRSCAFNCKGCIIDADLEIIGKRIAFKLKGSPLAARTLGRLLRINHATSHWNSVLNSELWELKQEKDDILPALRLSYIYLPFRLKRCFSLCAMFPKDYVFKMNIVVDIWLAQGFVEPQGQIPISTIGQYYFEELKDRSFFQLVPGNQSRDKYVIHDLIHDMLQLVSADECFVIRNEADLLNVPQNVQHLSLLTENNFDCKKFLDLSSCKKVRSILIKKSLNKTALIPIIDCWSSSLKYLRFLSCGFNTITVLPECVANFKLLSCFKVKLTRICTFNTFPQSYCSLYNLQTFVGRNCIFENLPRDFSRLVNLHLFDVKALRHERYRTLFKTDGQYGYLIKLLKNMNLHGDLDLEGVSRVLPDFASQIELSKQKYLRRLIVTFDNTPLTSDTDMRVLEALCPHPNIQCLVISKYIGTSSPIWFKPSNLQSLMQLHLIRCAVVTVSWAGGNSGTYRAMFASLVDLLITNCSRISSLEQLLQPASLPAIKTITIELCPELAHLCVETFKDFQHLKALSISHCPKINWQMFVGLPSSLENLKMFLFGHYSNHFVSHLQGLTFLLSLSISCDALTLIPQQVWSSLERVDVENCGRLTKIDFTQRSLPAVKIITIQGCEALLSLPGERFGEFRFLEELKLSKCQNIRWRGLAFPPSLQKLYIENCGDISAWIPDSLLHLDSLSHLTLKNLKHIKSIAAEIWSHNLSELDFLEIAEEEDFLEISQCPDLLTIGGSKGIAGIKNVFVEACGKLKGIRQPFRRGKRTS
ncbi:hypothetical protein ACQ4PT_065354 [Festuca glaucescens]